MSLLLPLLDLLTRTVQKEPLIKQLPIFLEKLDITHYMQDLPSSVLHAVLNADAVSRLLKPGHAFPKLTLIFVYNRIGNHVKPFRHQFLLRLVSQNLQCRPVNA